MSETEHSLSRRATRRHVHTVDHLAGVFISVGGFLVIVAVLGICVYLVAEVLPLFRGATVHDAPGVSTPATSPRLVVCDEYKRSALLIDAQGGACLVNLGDGRVVSKGTLASEGRRVTAMSRESSSGRVAIGQDDGSVRTGEIQIEGETLGQNEIPASVASLEIGKSGVVPPSGDDAWGAVVERISETQFRVLRPKIEFGEPAELENGKGGVISVDLRTRGSDEVLVAMREDGSVSYELVSVTHPLGGGTPKTSLSPVEVKIALPDGRAKPDWTFVTGDQNQILLLWRDGLCQRYHSPNVYEKPFETIETADLVPEGSITTASMQLGGLTLLLGDEKGNVHSAFVAVDPARGAADGGRLVVAYRHHFGDARITSIGVGNRDRTVVVGDAAGKVHVFNPTSRKELVSGMGAFEGEVAAALPAPKLDGILAFSGEGQYRVWAAEMGHPEASIRSLFGKLWYEGTPEPSFVYQSSAGEDTSEIKYSLVPLVFGTIKATVFAMLFAVPLAVLAAVYTSEFMDKHVRRVVKPTIEMMASLPSVVLGFVAAIVVAPLVRDILPTVLMSFFVVPLGMLVAAYAWQLVPPPATRKVRSGLKLTLMFVIAAGSLALAALTGPAVERALFKPSDPERWAMAGSVEPVSDSERPAWLGNLKSLSPDERRRLRVENGLFFQDGTLVRAVEPSDAKKAEIDAMLAQNPSAAPSIRTWLDGGFGGPWPGWVLVLIGPVAVVLSVLNAKFVSRAFHERLLHLPRLTAALAETARFAALIGATLGVSAGVAALLSSAGLDPRDSFFGSFNQRNTLVVGIIMGFAVIPIIYTISEDALSSVPNTLRSASLGAGATPWQTAVRIVMPVAASGIFSAVMIGLGRAAGETMIVVMATGNTATMKWNVFEGFRTLSATIAVELPEAPVGSAHFRVLFLCGLVLFAMTFILNTTAEAVRQRFRKRSAAL
ncbi:MAG: ABC transporter permease subunit [Phycisphaerales bacterium]